MKYTAVAFGIFLITQTVFASTPYRMIAILENERATAAEPGVTLQSYFHNQDAAVRARAVLAAGRIGNPLLVGDVALMAKDSNAEVRQMTAFALGQIRSKDGLPAIQMLLKDQDPEVRRLAIEAAGRIGGLEMTPSLLPFLDDSLSKLREQAALSLALIKDKGTVDKLIEKASKDDPAQWSYVYALYRLADDRSADVLHRVLGNPSESPSTSDPSSTLFALKTLWGMKKPLTAEETERLLSHADARIQQNALDVLAVSGDKSSCEAIRKHFDSMNVASQWKSLDAMAALDCSSIEEKMKFLGDGNLTLKSTAIGLIGKKDADRYFPVFDRTSRDPEWQVRWKAAEAAVNLSYDSAMQILKRLMTDSDSMVRLAAIDSLGTFLPKTSDILIPFLKSKDFAERATVADSLGKTKDRKYLPLLIETYNSSSDPNEIEGRIAVLDVLADYNDSQTLDVFAKALNDPEYTIRSHAIDGLKKLAGSHFYQNGRVVNPEDFLFRKDPVRGEVLAKYPADFGVSKEFEADLVLEKGTVKIHLLGNSAPLHVQNFKALAEKGFYDGLRIHRVVPNFVIQGGDPRGDGWGGAGAVLHDQFNTLPYVRGAVGMPTAGKDTGGSQFFITMSRQPHLDGNYTVFGEVISGMEFVDATEIGDKILKVTVVTR